MAQGVLTQSTGILHHPPGGWSNAASNHFKQAALLWRNIKEQRHTSPPYIPGIVETSSSQAPTVRRRLRRRVRPRAFTNARTATRSLDLPLAIGDPSISLPPASPSSVHRWIPASARRPQRRGLLCMVPVTPLYTPFRRPPRRNGNRPRALFRTRSIGLPEEQTLAPALVSGRLLLRFR